MLRRRPNTIGQVVGFVTPRQARAAGLRQRRNVVGTDRAARERRLCDRVLNHPAVSTAHLVGVFLADDGEPSLDQLILSLRDAGKRLALPVLDDDPASFAMTFCEWSPADRLVLGRYGIARPERLIVCDPDLVLVPLVAFDRAGNRVGRGKGFFDRYLADSTAHKLGVGFACQGFDALPVQPHDVPLNGVVTEDESLQVTSFRPTKN